MEGGRKRLGRQCGEGASSQHLPIPFSLILPRVLAVLGPPQPGPHVKQAAAALGEHPPLTGALRRVPRGEAVHDGAALGLHARAGVHALDEGLRGGVAGRFGGCGGHGYAGVCAGVCAGVTWGGCERVFKFHVDCDSEHV